MVEISVKVSNEETKLVRKFILYDVPITVSTEDEQLKELVKTTTDSFKGHVDDVFITIRMIW